MIGGGEIENGFTFSAGKPFVDLEKGLRNFFLDFLQIINDFPQIINDFPQISIGHPLIFFSMLKRVPELAENIDDSIAWGKKCRALMTQSRQLHETTALLL